MGLGREALALSWDLGSCLLLCFSGWVMVFYHCSGVNFGASPIPIIASLCFAGDEQMSLLSHGAAAVVSLSGVADVSAVDVTFSF